MVVAVLWAISASTRALAQDEKRAMAQSPPPVRSAEPARFGATLAPLAIDGRLDEPSWTSAPPVTRFFEIYPGNVGPPPARTEVRFLYDDHNVYVGVRAHDPEPRKIRAPLAKRDQMSADQDYVEIFIDTMNERRNALVFRTNARGVSTDAQFDEHTQARSLAPDFSFDVRTSIDDFGWSAEFRIPLSTLRYESGSDRPWAFVVFRGYPRSNNVRIASAPIPRGANCQLCFAAGVAGISLPAASVPLSISPHVAYSHSEADSGPIRIVGQELGAGIDVRWQPQPNSTVDFTVQPDFSQVEADAVQLAANARFALFLPEKRPFFLEGVDVLSTPITALYTRSLTDPDFGARVTYRGDRTDFSALAVHDAGGGSIIEPGPTASLIGGQESDSKAFVGRYELSNGSTTLGVLGSARLNDDRSDNFVTGADAIWSPSSSDRFVAQLLWSQTTNPDRPDLLPTWTGQHLAGSASTLRWEHRRDAWYADVSHERLSREFRAWNGFVPQVGVSSLTAAGGLNFYPEDSHLVRVSPALQYSIIREAGGGQIDGSASIAVTVDAGRSTSFTLTVLRDRELAHSGLEELDYASVRMSTSPSPWVPSIALGAGIGDALDLGGGEIADAFDLSASLRLRLFERFDLDTSIAHLQLNSRGSGATSSRLLTDSAGQVMATWHFSGRLYSQFLYQRSITTRPLSNDETDERRSTGNFSSFLFSYQSDWRTRFFVGLSHGVDTIDSIAQPDSKQTEVFAKFACAFAVDRSSPLLGPFQRRAMTTSLARRIP